jgi:hypothetical protein
MADWYILLPFGIFVSHFDIFSHLGNFVPRKSGNLGQSADIFAKPEKNVPRLKWRSDLSEKNQGHLV